MFVQLSPSPPHLHSSVHTTLFPLHEHLREHFDFSQLHLTSCSTETGAGATLGRTGTSFWSRYLHPKVRGSRQVGFNTISWCHMLAWTWARRICSVHAPWVGGSLSTPCSSLSCLNKNHLSIFASPVWTPPGHKREHRNSSQPRSTSSDGSSPSPRPASAIRMVGLAFMEAAKQPLFPFSWICPVVSQPVRASQLIKAPGFSGPILSYRL